MHIQRTTKRREENLGTRLGLGGSVCCMVHTGALQHNEQVLGVAVEDGYFKNSRGVSIPLAVSPESMTQSAPSSTALATSLASARVGRGLPTILSNIYIIG